EKFRAFIRRTPNITTDKPESVGHIMTRAVSVLPESTHIADLISLMSNQGYRQIPIVNNENRLVGMVYQANLIAALYNESHDYAKNQPLFV
ncbi:MAG TPA: CBS domain-containing protein, partial [archaeon]